MVDTTKMDVGRDINIVKALDGDNAKKVQYVLASGMNSSALEHSVPEQMFSTPDNPAEGVSAVKALKIANDQGIPIYTINQTNIDTILPQLQVDPDVKADIVNAVNAGKVVTVSKANINFNGWTGVGYIIIDPTTGNGAYMISGGKNGGWVILLTIITILVLHGVALILATAILGASILIGILGAFLSGLAIGLISYALLPQKAIDLMKIFIKPLLLKFLMPFLFVIGMPIAAATAFIAWLIISIIEWYEKNKDKRTGYYDKHFVQIFCNIHIRQLKETSMYRI